MKVGAPANLFPMKTLLGIPKAIGECLILFVFAVLWVFSGFSKVSRDLDRKEND